MKKLNAKGFTLIELLAVITIMGILMMVAIPTVSRTIENSRKDTFLDTANQYVNGVKNMWAADTLSCAGYDGTGDYVSSAVPEGLYYVEVQTLSTSVPVLLEQGGKSSWGSRNVAGYILIAVDDVANGTKSNRKVTYYPVLVDGIHGINVTAAATKPVVWDTANKQVNADSTTAEANTAITRGDILMTGATYNLVTGSDTLAATTEITAPGSNAKRCTEV